MLKQAACRLIATAVLVLQLLSVSTEELLDTIAATGGDTRFGSVLNVHGGTRVTVNIVALTFPCQLQQDITANLENVGHQWRIQYLVHRSRAKNEKALRVEMELLQVRSWAKRWWIAIILFVHVMEVRRQCRMLSSHFRQGDEVAHADTRPGQLTPRTRESHSR